MTIPGGDVRGASGTSGTRSVSGSWELWMGPGNDVFDFKAAQQLQVSSAGPLFLVVLWGGQL